MKQLATILFFLAQCVHLYPQTDIHIAKYWGNRNSAVSYTFDDSLEEHYTKVLDYIAKHRDSIWVAPFADVAAYIAERDNVKLNVYRKNKKTIIVPAISLDKTIYNHPLTLVMTSTAPLTAVQNNKSLYVRRRNGYIMIDFIPGDGRIEIMEMPSYRSGEPVPVFLTAGQSNTDGRVYGDEMPEWLRHGYKYLHYADVTSSSDGHFGPRTFKENRGRWSYCDVVNYLLDNSLHTDFYSVKAAYGGTSIDTLAGGPKRPVWYADVEWLARNNAYRGDLDNGKSLTKSLIEGFSECVDTTLNCLPQGYDVKAIMWHQGESDRNKGADYYKNFKDMICYMRNSVSQITGKAKDKSLPFIFGTVSHSSRQYNAEVEAAQRRVAEELPNIYVIDLSKAWLGRDGLHFGADWTERIGRMMYNMLVQIGIVKDNEEDTGIY